jgi:hypothetical protein
LDIFIITIVLFGNFRFVMPLQYFFILTAVYFYFMLFLVSYHLISKILCSTPS